MAADPAMRAFAEEEVAAARARMATLEAELQKLLLPVSSDPVRRHERRELKRVLTFPTAAESRELIRNRLWLFPKTNFAFALSWPKP